MKRTKMKKYVSMGSVWNEAGFTYVSMLFSLLLLMLSMPFVVYFLQHVRPDTDQAHIDAHQFFTYVRHDIKGDVQLSAADDKLFVYLPTGETAVLEKYQDLIRRRVDGKGHEIYIRNVEGFIVEADETGVHLKIMMLNGEQYEKKFIHQTI